MVNVNGGRDWSAATKDCPDFSGSLTQVKYFSTNLITVRAHRGHTWSEATQNLCKIYQLSVCKIYQLSADIKEYRLNIPNYAKKHKQTAAALWLRKRKKRDRNYQMRMNSSHEIFKYDSLTSPVARNNIM